MHTEMWEHPAVQENLATLRRRGVHVIEPGVGRLAGGDDGVGRLAEPERIVAATLALAGRSGALAGRQVLVAAGGTREPIDPVRFLGNRSSGKMGHAIAREAFARGARVTLLTSVPSSAPAGVELVAVETADDVHREVMARAPHADVVVMAAAVADFRPKAVADQKLKKGDGVPDLVLEPTVDVLAALGRAKAPHQIVVGFAAETERVREHAADKLAAKRVDLMVANDVSSPDSGFEVDTNRALLLHSSGRVEELPLLTKDALAGVVLDRVAGALDAAAAGGSTEELG
jgi:phosphopantothenoylcysteine decarboxylase/phosphopantothenate--cysteine ligase